MKKKIVSLFLSVVMILSMLPTYTVFAAEVECNHIFTENTLPDDNDEFWDTHSKDKYYVGSAAFISAEMPAGCTKIVDGEEQNDGWVLEATESTGFCVICGEFIGEKTPVPAKDHNFVKDDELSYDPDCENEGLDSEYCTNKNYKLEVTQNPETGLYTAGVIAYDCDVTYEEPIPANGHSFTEYVSNEDATCTEDGTKTAVCDNGCGTEDTITDEGSVLGHDWADDVTDPDCENGGYTTHTCNRCQEVMVDSETPELGHDYVATAKKDADCINKGYTTYVCSRCDDEKIDDSEDALGHDFVASEPVPATCLEDGYVVYTCSRCGESYEADQDKYPALGHDKLTETVQKETCADGGKQGIYKITCSRCDFVEYQYVDAPRHNIPNPTILSEQTCTSSKIEKGVCSVCEEDAVNVVPPLGHDFVIVTVPVTCTTDGYKKSTCKRCGAEFITDFVEATGHSFTDYVSNNDATCTEDGTKTAVCDNGCGETDTIADEGTATGHSFTDYVSNNDATCTEDGTKTAVCDNGCGTTDTITDEGSALGHEYEVEVVAPTCTEDGYTKHTCIRGDDEYTDEETAALEHDYEVEVVAPTCTEGGYTKHTCIRGDDEYTDEEKPALGHHVVRQDDSYEATCTEAGRNVFVCDRCGDYSFIEYLAPQGHLWDEGTITKYPTCTEEGEMTYYCTRVSNGVACTETKTAPIEPTDHNYEDDSDFDCLHGKYCTNVDENTGEICGAENDERDDSLEFADNVSAAPNGADESYSVDGYDFDPDYDIIHTGHDYEWTFVPATCEFDAYWIGTCVRERDEITCPENENIKHSTVRVDCLNTAFGHNWSLLDDNSSKKPTCNEEGYRHYQCLNDHSHKYTEKIPATGHNFVEREPVAATCKEGAYIEVVCDNEGCTEHFRRYTSEPLGHNYVVDRHVPADCNNPGYDVYKCTRCEDDGYNKTTTSPLGHNYIVVDRVPADCTEQGYDVYRCTRCLHEYRKTTTPALGHEYEYYTSVAATCTQQGCDIYECARCGLAQVKTVTPATGHTFVASNFVEPTCQTRGYTTYVCINKNCTQHFDADFIAPLGHSYIAEVVAPTCKDGGYTTYTCEVCHQKRLDSNGNIYKTDYTEKAAHVLNIVKTIPATCEAEGKVIWTCVNCGDTIEEYIPATGHNFGKVEVKEATCTESGYTKYTCTLCGFNYVTDTTDLVDHVLDVVATQAPTCAIDGYVTYQCVNCKDYTFNEIIPATGDHRYSDIIDVEPTCAEDGVMIHQCENCDYSYTTVIPATADHLYDEKVTKAPTCAAKGEMTYTCSVCGYKYTEELPVTDDHLYDAFVSLEPTCAAEGEMTYACSVCGNEYYEELPKTDDHLYNETVTKAPTCAAKGEMTYTCSVCGYKYTEELPVTDDHRYVETVQKAETCAIDGVMLHKCSVCDNEYTTVIQATGDHLYADVTDGELGYVAATCGADGVMVHKCNVCGDIYTTVIPATGDHLFEDVTDEELGYVAATCTEEGKMIHKCNVCGDIYTTVIPKLSHEYTLTIKKEATCTKSGVAVATCKNCGDSQEYTLPATGHKYGNAETFAATCINKKYTEIKCTTCGETVYYKAEGDLGGHKEVTTVSKAATTSKDGKLANKCQVCNKTVSTTVIPSIKTVTLSYTTTAYTGNAKKPSVKVVDRTGATISNKYYTVKYADNKAIGTATVTVTFSGRYSGTVTKKFTINPKGVGISSVTTKDSSITVAYGKVANADGYQIQYSTKSDYSTKTSKTISSNKTTSYTIKSLKKGQKYYIRIRSYKVVNGTKYYGKWTTMTKTCK